ncbi:MAG: FimV/HubP family polar landmark protein [Gammaproteobacteria bacterium]
MKISFSRLRFYLSWFFISTLISFISYANDYSDESQINVSKSDFNNLWSIAIELKSEINNVSVYQIMMAFQDLNETSFDRNNINYLKKTSFLEIPSSSFIETFDTSQSIFEVARQNSLIDSKFTYFSVLESEPLKTLTDKKTSSINPETMGFIDQLNNDPFEKFNRRVHDFNSSIDDLFFKPAAEIYNSGTPEFFQLGISNIFGNLGDASSAANNILQLKPVAFIKDLSRFLINSTMGIFGIFDIASEMGIEESREDFGQTLGHWGISSGPYIVIPFYGPSNFRDSFSIIPDLYLYPNVPRDDSARIGTGALNLLDLRSDLLGVTEISGSDQYTFYRDAYIQRRNYQINDGELEEDVMFDEFD